MMADSNSDEEHSESNQISCDTIRQKITEFLETKEMNQTAFLRAIGNVHASSFRKFMQMKGHTKGCRNSTFTCAAQFFHDRELLAKSQEKATEKAISTGGKKKRKVIDISDDTGGNVEVVHDLESAKNQETATEKADSTRKRKKKAIEISDDTEDNIKAKPPGKRCKSAEEAQKRLAEIHAVSLGSATQNVYDDCDEIRRKILDFMSSENISARQISLSLGLSAIPVHNFLTKKGWNEGSGSDVYPKAYCFFEKLRILRNEPKSAHRLKSEKEFPEWGYPLGKPQVGKWALYEKINNFDE